MLKSRSAFRTLAKNRANSPSPSSRQGRLFPPLRQDLGHALVRKQSPYAVRASQAHPAPRPAQAERSVWCSRRVPPRCHGSEPPKARKADPKSHPNAGLRATNSRAPDSLQHPKQLGRRLLQHNPPEAALAAYFVLISELSPRRLTVRLATGASLAVGRAVSSVKKSVARRQPIDRPANDSWEARSDRQYLCRLQALQNREWRKL